MKIGITTVGAEIPFKFNFIVIQLVIHKFLDINMPNMSGMDFLKTLKNPPNIIITTAYPEYALESYEFDVVDYLKKPFSFERFYKSIQKVQEKASTKSEPKASPQPALEKPETAKNYLFVKSDKKIIKINFTDILFAESYGDYIKIHTAGEITMVLMPLKKLLEQLPQSQFFRLHKSYIIAIDKIDVVEGNMVHINKNVIPVGKNFRQDFFNLIKPD